MSRTHIARLAAGESCRMPQWLEPKLGFLRSKAENREKFFARIAEIFPPNDPRYRMIEKAYEIAKRAFEKISRDGGDRYFEHLRAATLIVVVYLRVRDPDIIAATLLHDIIEDIRGWSVARLTREFNPRVADIVWWVTKPAGRQYKTEDDVDRKYHRQLRDAPREAVIVKLADRLHNLMTIWTQDPARIERKISETRDFILPLAEYHQLLIHEMEDVLRQLEMRK